MHHISLLIASISILILFSFSLVSFYFVFCQSLFHFHMCLSFNFLFSHLSHFCSFSFYSVDLFLSFPSSFIPSLLNSQYEFSNESKVWRGLSFTPLLAPDLKSWHSGLDVWLATPCLIENHTSATYCCPDRLREKN